METDPKRGSCTSSRTRVWHAFDCGRSTNLAILPAYSRHPFHPSWSLHLCSLLHRVAQEKDDAEHCLGRLSRELCATRRLGCSDWTGWSCGLVDGLASF